MYHRFHGRLLQGQTLSICWITPKSHCQYLQIAILTIHQFMPEGIFHEMHHRRNIRSPATTDQARGRLDPRAVLALDCCLTHILLHLIPLHGNGVMPLGAVCEADWG